MGSFIFLILPFIILYYIVTRGRKEGKEEEAKQYIEDESYEMESLEDEVYESESQRKERERQERYDEYVEKCLLLDAESGFRKINEYNVLTAEQESWYDNYVETFCGIGKTNTKYKLTSLIKKGDEAAKFFRLALEIGDAQNAMIECKRDWGYYGHDNIDKKEEAINELIEWSREHNSIYGISFPVSGMKGLSIVYFEHDGFAFACYIAASKNITALKDINKNYPRIPNNCQPLTVEDILPRLEDKLMEKYSFS